MCALSENRIYILILLMLEMVHLHSSLCAHATCCHAGEIKLIKKIVAFSSSGGTCSVLKLAAVEGCASY